MSVLHLLSNPCIPSFPCRYPSFKSSAPKESLRSLIVLSLSNPKTSLTKSSTTALAMASSWQPPKYVYPDPIPQFAAVETEKFRGELRKKLLRNREAFGDDIDTVVDICAQIFSEFLHKEYGGPGTLVVEPFTDMLLALKERKLQGAPVAARAALLWAQNFVDQDWELWNSSSLQSQPSNLNTSAGPPPPPPLS